MKRRFDRVQYMDAIKAGVWR